MLSDLVLMSDEQEGHLSICLSLSVIGSPVVVLIGAVLFWRGPSAFFIPSYINRLLPVAEACFISMLSSVQYSLAHFLASRCTAVLAAWSEETGLSRVVLVPSSD